MEPDLAARQQAVRVLVLLDGLARAGLVPTAARALHELAYLANVLSPVFELIPFDAKLLKRFSGPYYPDLQLAIDRLVGRSLVDALDIEYRYLQEDKRYRVVASYRLRRPLVQAALDRHAEVFPEEALFLRELASAYSVLSDDQLGQAALQDARYADTSVDVDNVIDFGEYASPSKNFSRNAALAFAPGRRLEPAERLYLYLDHLSSRVPHVG
ncbi:hypothetical protein [Pseudoxanthomonas mexicana]